MERVLANTSDLSRSHSGMGVERRHSATAFIYISPKAVASVRFSEREGYHGFVTIVLALGLDLRRGVRRPTVLVKKTEECNCPSYVSYVL